MLKKLKEFFEKILSSIKNKQPEAIPVVISKPEEKNESVDFSQSTPDNPKWDFIANNIKLDPEVKKLEQLKLICDQIFKSIERYQEAERLTKVPYDLVAALHFMESSLNFNTILHNGTPLGQVSTIVPKGVKFNRWIDSVVDALNTHGAGKIQKWDLTTKLAFAEKYNGTGYRNHGEYSSYVCSYTNFHDETGKYVADGKYDPNAPIKRPGVAAILLMLDKYKTQEIPKDNTPIASLISREMIHNLLLERTEHYAGSKEYNNSNTDRGGNIDHIITKAGGRIPEFYCADTNTCVVIEVCEKLGIGYPKGLYRGSSSQGFKNKTDSKYILNEFIEWCIFVHTNIPLDGHGHTGLGIKKLNNTTFKTFEGNWANQVNYFEKQFSYVSAYIDVVQAIIDQYKFEKGLK